MICAALMTPTDSAGVWDLVWFRAVFEASQRHGRERDDRQAVPDKT